MQRAFKVTIYCREERRPATSSPVSCPPNLSSTFFSQRLCEKTLATVLCLFLYLFSVYVLSSVLRVFPKGQNVTRLVTGSPRYRSRRRWTGVLERSSRDLIMGKTPVQSRLAQAPRLPLFEEVVRPRPTELDHEWNQGRQPGKGGPAIPKSTSRTHPYPRTRESQAQSRIISHG